MPLLPDRNPYQPSFEDAIERGKKEDDQEVMRKRGEALYRHLEELDRTGATAPPYEECDISIKRIIENAQERQQNGAPDEQA